MIRKVAFYGLLWLAVESVMVGVACWDGVDGEAGGVLAMFYGALGTYVTLGVFRLRES